MSRPPEPSPLRLLEMRARRRRQIADQAAAHAQTAAEVAVAAEADALLARAELIQAAEDAVSLTEILAEPPPDGDR